MQSQEATPQGSDNKLCLKEFETKLISLVNNLTKKGKSMIN
jgi:hypothetical protein